MDVWPRIGKAEQGEQLQVNAPKWRSGVGTEDAHRYIPMKSKLGPRPKQRFPFQVLQELKLATDTNRFNLATVGSGWLTTCVVLDVYVVSSGSVDGPATTDTNGFDI